MRPTFLLTPWTRWKISPTISPTPTTPLFTLRETNTLHVRTDDDPKKTMMKKWDLSEAQADAILNMRLRALRKLEEIAISKEHDGLSVEGKDIQGLLENEDRRWKVVAEQIGEIKTQFGRKTELGRRRTGFAEAPSTAEIVSLEAMIEREPVTVLCSEKGWIRVFKGHMADEKEIKYKEGDRGKFTIHTETTDKLLVFGTNGRFYMLPVDKLPRGRGHGEPLRLMIDLGNDEDVASFLAHVPGRRLLVASTDGRGFIVPEDDVVAQTRNGKQVMNVSGDSEARTCVPVVGEHIAVIGDTRRLLIFKVDELPEMSRGRGVLMQRYNQGGLSDVKCFSLDDGLVCGRGERTRTFTDLDDWIGKRSQAGRLPPSGFGRAAKF